MRDRRHGFFFCLFMFTGSVGATDVTACLTVEDPTARLACYDTAAGRKPAVVPQPATEPAVAAAEFGVNDRMRREKADNAPTEPDALTATVTEAQRNRTGYFTLTLDNGQRWYVTETSSTLWFAPGDEVTIRRGMLGSYLLTRAKGGGSWRTRRIE